MPTKYRYKVWLFDETTVEALKAAAVARDESISGFALKAIQEALAKPASMQAGECPRCVRARERSTTWRRRQGMRAHADRGPKFEDGPTSRPAR